MGIPPFPQPVKAPQFRNGEAWKKSELDKWIQADGLMWGLLLKTEENNLPQVEDAYARTNKVLGEENEAYKKIMSEFRGSIKNDLASLSATADRVQKETTKLAAAYKNAVATLTSEDMLRAIANAERLATALKAISDLQSHSITFAVLDKKPASTVSPAPADSPAR